MLYQTTFLCSDITPTTGCFAISLALSSIYMVNIVYHFPELEHRVEHFYILYLLGLINCNNYTISNYIISNLLDRVNKLYKLALQSGRQHYLLYSYSRTNPSTFDFRSPPIIYIFCTSCKFCYCNAEEKFSEQ